MGRTLVSEMDLDRLLMQVLEEARELTGARYAALGILDEARTELERFLTVGIDQRTRRAIGDLPRGRGILGLLIAEPAPLRLHDLGMHPRAYGFPANHPPMHSFLGVPILVRGSAWGNIYLAEKEGGDFTDEDEHSLVVLADWAAVAINNARLYHDLQTRRNALEHAVETLEATTAIARALGAETQLERVLELIVKRGRALVEARSMVILLARGDELAVVATAGEAQAAVVGQRIPVAGSLSGEVLHSGRPERVPDVRARLGAVADRMGAQDAQTALLVPLVFRGTALGVLTAFDRLGAERQFGSEHERLLEAFAASAATAVATAQSVEADRLRQSLLVAEQERRRWARELHDETLQGLGGLQLLLTAALRSGDPTHLQGSVGDAVTQIGSEIDKLRALITELRPTVLDQLGLAPALKSLVDRVREVHGLDVTLSIDLAPSPDDERLPAEAETTVYRLVQEALTNVVKHAEAEHAEVAIERRDDVLQIVVSDDGRGFDVDAPRTGFGLSGMLERVRLLEGSLDVTSDPKHGTVVRALLPPGEPEPSEAVGR